jgi:hypothetical protein
MKALQSQTQESLSFNSLQQSSSMEKGKENEFSRTPAILMVLPILKVKESSLLGTQERPFV